MIFAVVLIPFLLGVLVFFLPRPIMRRIIWLAASLVHLVLVLFMFIRTPQPILGGWLAVDALGLLFLGIVSVLFFICSIYGYGYLSTLSVKHESGSPDRERIFITGLLLFLATMTLVTLSHHLGLLWVAVEATTLASAPLIFFHRTVHSLEATWKYLLICSVGIALALFGTFFLAAASAAGSKDVSLTLDYLLQMGPHLDVRLLRIAFIFLVVGYGTKMGLAPMHTWLPDAHSEAPSMVSALLSGVLLNCAFLAILRSYQVCQAAGEAVFAQNILLIFGLVSILLATVFIINQPDYKRLLAYSSVEHMGILALGIGLGPAGFYFALFHALNHSLTKSGLFLTAGNILAIFKTKTIQEISGLGKQQPIISAQWIAGFLAIAGMPLFGIFISEFNLLGVAILQGRVVVAVIFIFLLTVIFIGMAAAILPMTQGPGKNAPAERRPAILWIAPLILLGLTFLLGLFIPGWLDRLLTLGVSTLGGGR